VLLLLPPPPPPPLLPLSLQMWAHLRNMRKAVRSSAIS